MKHLPPIPYESRILRVLKQRHEAIQADRQLALIAAETNTPLPHTKVYTSTIGSEAELRGIPVVGVRGGYGGAIRGTRPGTIRT